MFVYSLTLIYAISMTGISDVKLIYAIGHKMYFFICTCLALLFTEFFYLQNL